MRKLITHGEPNSQPYADIAIGGGLIFTSGQIPISDDGTVPVDFGEQVSQVLSNLEMTLQNAGSDLDNILKITVYLDSLDDFDVYNRIYVEKLSAHGLPPRTTVEVSRFRGSKRIELDAVASAPGDKQR